MAWSKGRILLSMSCMVSFVGPCAEAMQRLSLELEREGHGSPASPASSSSTPLALSPSSVASPLSPNGRQSLSEFRKNVRESGGEERLLWRPGIKIPPPSANLLTVILPDLEDSDWDPKQASGGALHAFISGVILASPHRWVEIYRMQDETAPLLACNIPKTPAGRPLGDAHGEGTLSNLCSFVQWYSEKIQTLQEIADHCMIAAKEVEACEPLSAATVGHLATWRGAVPAFVQTWNAMPLLEKLGWLIQDIRDMRQKETDKIQNDGLFQVGEDLYRLQDLLRKMPEHLSDLTVYSNVLKGWVAAAPSEEGDAALP